MTVREGPHEVPLVVFRALAALAAGLVMVLALAACEPLGPEELQREVESIESVAAEGSVLGDRIAAQETKRTFARVQARELADAADHSAQRLTDAHPAEGLTPQVERAIRLAEGVSGQVGSLEVAPDAAASAQGAASELRSLAARAKELAESL
jgi:hypothetical protein